MFCSNCGRENREESKFCTGCGNPITRNNIDEVPIDTNAQDKHGYEKSSSGSRKNLFIGLGITAGVIVACVAGYFGVMATMKPVDVPNKPQVQENNTNTNKKPENSSSTEITNGNIDLSAKSKSNGYIAKDSSVKLLTEEELLGLSRDDLGLIRNEIYARYGYIFKSPTYADYFGKKTWYTPNNSFKGNESDLNEIERKNIALIKSLEGM